MAKDWSKLAGETGHDVPSGRFDRMMRVGKLGVSLGAGAVARRMANVFRTEEQTNAAKDEFLVQQGEKIAKVLGEMKGATMKIGQILSSDPDLVPPQLMDALQSLQAEAPPMTYNTVRQVIEDAFDRPLDSVFSYFDPEPIGAASIGQVHRGRLTSGEDVAVKVQYPGIIETLDSDMRNLGSVMTLSRVVIDKQRVREYLEEVKKAIVEEADYEAEADNLEHFHEVLKDRPGIRTPRPFREWCRRTVLVMELAKGTKLDEALDAMEPSAERTDLLARFVGIYVWMFHDRNELHADPHPGNFLIAPDGDLIILDFGCVKSCDPQFADGILDIMDACWQNDDQRAAALYQQLGFGKDGADSSIYDPALLRRYHDIALRPFLVDEVFDFGAWELRRQLQSFVMKNPAFLKLTPPAEGLLIFRVMGGIKGMLGRTSGQLNVHRMAVETARRNGRLTGDPLIWSHTSQD